VVVDGQEGGAARVHDARQLRQAALGGARLLLLSPIFKTRSHPTWRPLPRMRAAALLRLARAPVIALGGMDSRRFAQVAPLGFQGWAGIDAFRT
jgi:thiamine-phosphate pyrophosphorylase